MTSAIDRQNANTPLSALNGADPLFTFIEEKFSSNPKDKCLFYQSCPCVQSKQEIKHLPVVGAKYALLLGRCVCVVGWPLQSLLTTV